MSKRKNPYVAGIAQINFKPKFDWEISEADKLYSNSTHPIEKNKILYEDCIEGMKKLPKECVDLIIADPPFGIKFNGKENFYNRKSEFVIDGYKEISDNYDDFTYKWIKELPRLMKSSSSAFIFSGWTNLKDVLNAAEKANLTLINHIIWRYQFGVFTQRKFVTSHYHILFLVKNPDKYFFNKIEHYPLDIWDIPRKFMPGQKKNGTKLPEDVVIKAINFVSKPGDIIFDPFMGNGTTAVCAKLTFRNYFGFELNVKMREIIENNISMVEIGSLYEPYHMKLPSLEELAKKYPAVKKHIQKNNVNTKEIIEKEIPVKKQTKQKKKTDLTSFLE